MRDDLSIHPRRRRRGRRRPAVGVLAAAVAVATALGVTSMAQAEQDPASDSEPAQADTLREAAASSGRFAGLGVTASDLANEYPELAGEQFSSLTPGNEMKWGSLEGTRGEYTWGPADEIVEYAQQHDQEIHGHTLVWHSQLPGWVENGDFADGELLAEMTRHITTTADRYAGQIDRWDVVNEPFNEDGTLRDSVFLQEIGLDYIAEALRTADDADPDAKLYINDYNVEGVNAKSDGLYNLVSDLLDQGVPIDGVGFQSHLILGQVPADMQENIQRFVDLGLEVTITEIDVRIEMPADDAEIAQQAEDYAAIAEACVAVEGCVGLTVWGVSDCCSWVPDVFPGYGAPLLWDENYEPKPAYDAFLAALGGQSLAGEPEISP